MNYLIKKGLSGQLLLMCFVLLFSGAAQAQLRVLVKFDETEHRIHRLVTVKSNNPELAQQLALHADELSADELRAGKVSVLWLSVDGAVLLRSAMEDPRITHAPLSGADSNPTFVSLSEGAYMVSGPKSSAMLEIRLPANSALGLQAQIWQFQLNL